MITIYRHEMRTYYKSLLTWAVCVGGMGLFCILLFSSMKDSMADMAESFATLGAFSDALGMSQLSIATLKGFYATEVGTIHALGGAMFSSIISTGMLSKEEEGHTGEFLYSLPVSRGKVVMVKWLAVVTHILLFNVICVCMYVLGSLFLGEALWSGEFLRYHIMQFVMQVEIAAVCYAVSACMNKNRFGLGLGIVLLLYAFDMIARVVPDLSDYKILSPFSYANAADILSSGEILTSAAVVGLVVFAASLGLSYMLYTKRDLAA